MANLFSLTVFFVVFREALEAALVVSVLLSLVEQIVHNDPPAGAITPPDPESTPSTASPRILKKLRLQACTPYSTCVFSDASPRSSSVHWLACSSPSPLVEHLSPSGSPRRKIYGRNRKSYGKARIPYHILP